MTPTKNGTNKEQDYEDQIHIIQHTFKQQEAEYQGKIISLEGNIEDLKREIGAIDSEKANLAARYHKEKQAALQDEIRISVRDWVDSMLDKLELQLRWAEAEKNLLKAQKIAQNALKPTSVPRLQISKKDLKNKPRKTKGSKFNLNNISLNNPQKPFPNLKISSSKFKLKPQGKFFKSKTILILFLEISYFRRNLF